jgi:hypothetical protein
MAPIFAHASGFSWDEALLVLAPLLVIGAVLVAINRRAGRLQDEELERETAEPQPPDAPKSDGRGIGAG